MRLSRRSRKTIVATAAAITLAVGTGGAHAGFFGRSPTIAISQTIPLPAVPTTYHEIGDGLASAYTPSLSGGSVTLSVWTSLGSLAPLATTSDFECPASAPKPVVSIAVPAGAGSTTVTAHIVGTTTLPDGTAGVYDSTIGPLQVSQTTNSTQLYKLCTA